MSIYHAIEDYIRAKTKRITPCEHDWEQILEQTFTFLGNPNYKWREWTYRCKKCCESKIISSDNTE